MAESRGTGKARLGRHRDLIYDVIAALLVSITQKTISSVGQVCQKTISSVGQVCILLSM